MLTDDEIRALKPKQKPYKVGFGKGLYLCVLPTGGLSWRFKYRLDGVEARLVFGLYPAMTIGEAIAARNEARQMLKDGLDPSAERQKTKAPTYNDTFQLLGEEWLAHMKAVEAWTARHAANVERSLVNHVYPVIGATRVRDLDGAAVLRVVRKIEDAGHTDMSYDVRTRMGMIFQFGIATGKATVDYAAAIKSLCKRHKKKHFAALDFATLPIFFARLRGLECHFATFYGLRVLIASALRPGKELRLARWEEIDFDAGVWTVPGERMKLHKDAGAHIVPLGEETIALLRELHTFSGKSGWLFPSAQPSKAGPISDSTLSGAMIDLGYRDKAKAHGMRALFATACNGEFPNWPGAIDVQLDHDVVARTVEEKHAKEVHKTYNRQRYIEQRWELMTWWSAQVAKAWEDSLLLPTDTPIPEPVSEADAFRARRPGRHAALINQQAIGAQLRAQVMPST